MAAVILTPVVVIFFRTLSSGGLDMFRNAAAVPTIGTAIRNSIIVVGCAGALAIIIGTAFAWLKERTDADLGIAGDALPLAPLLVPKVAMAIGWVFLASPKAGYLNVLIRWLLGLVGIKMESGPLNIFSWPGLVFLFTLDLIPYSFLIMSVAFRNLNPALDEASRISGAGTLKTLRRVTLPALKPALGASIFMMVVGGITVFSIPVIVGTGARIEFLSERIVRLVRSEFPPRLEEAVALSLAITVLVGGAWLVQRALTRGGRYATIGGKAGGVGKVSLGKYRGLARFSVVLFLLATSVFPVIGLVLVSVQPFWSPSIDVGELSFERYSDILSSSSLAGVALRNSIVLGLVSATVGVIVLTMMVVVARRTKGLSGTLIEGTIRIPGALSPIILAVAFLAFFAPAPFFLAGSSLLLVIAYVTIYLPQGAVSVESALRQIGTELEEASAVAGASKGKTFVKIVLPLMILGVTSGWAFFFVFVVGDLTASALLASPRDPVVGFVILSIYESGTFGDLAALSAIISCLTAIIVLSVLALGRRRKQDSTVRRWRSAVPD
jgi:iron(III) transport system permease protein